MDTLTEENKADLAQHAIEYALKRQIDQMRNILDVLGQIDKSLMNITSTNIARIAVVLKDKHIFRITDHYCRMIVEEYANDVEAITFIIDCYKETGYWEWFDVPQYIWGKVTIYTVHIVAGDVNDYKHYKEPLYSVCKPEVQEFLGYYECSNCGEVMQKDKYNLCESSYRDKKTK